MSDAHPEQASSPNGVQRDDVSDLKVEINTLIWQYAPKSTTLEQAEAIAVDVLSMILHGKTGAAIF